MDSLVFDPQRVASYIWVLDTSLSLILPSKGILPEEVIQIVIQIQDQPFHFDFDKLTK